MKETSTVQMQFNISEIRKSVGDYRLLTSAELRMLIKNTMFDKPQRVELYEGNASYLASRFIDNQMKDKWLSFDVTATVQQWLQGDGEITTGRDDNLGPLFVLLPQIKCIYLF